MHTPLVNASESREPLPAHQAILPWLGLLRQLYPPSAVLLVGAGSGTSPWVQHLLATGHRNVTLVEADEPTAARLKLVAQAQPSWAVQQGVVGRNSEHTPFYTASLQTESGLLEPESLRSLWPNLQTTHQQSRQAITLAELQQDAETPANWLLVDCLPALPIIQGAAQQLAAFDVIALRVLLSSTNSNSIELTQSASADALHPALQALGFRCLAIETSRHPAIGHALFVRDTAALAQQQQQQLAQQAQTLAQAQAATQQLTAERHKLSEQLQQTKEAAQKAQAAAAQAAAQATQQAQTAAQALATATAATEAAAKQAEERAAQVQQLTQAKAAADKLLGERMAQIQAHEQRLQQLQAHSAEADHLRGLLQTELTKAETQITLIKDLLFKEQGL